MSEKDIKAQSNLVKYESFDWDYFFNEQFALNKHLYLLGLTGSGKTTWLIWFYRKCPYRTVFFNSIGHLIIEKDSDLVCESLSELKECLNDKNTLDEINKICYTPKDKVISDMEILQKEWNYVSGLVYISEDYKRTEELENKGKIKNRDFKRKSNIVLINDETMYVTENEMIMPNHMGLMTRGRNYKISSIGATQRNQNIPKIITSQSRIKIIFELDLADVKYLTGRVAHVEKSLFIKEFHFIVVEKNKFKYYAPVEMVKELDD